MVHSLYRQYAEVISHKPGDRLPSLSVRPVVSDGYVPTHIASPPFNQYQLLDDRGTCGVDDLSSIFKRSAMFIIAIQLPHDVNT